MRFLRALVCVVILGLSQSASGYFPHGFVAPPTAQSELSMKPPNGGSDYPFLNYFKTSNNFWGYGTTTGAPSTGALIPSDLDSNGYPISTGQWTSLSGASTSFNVPSQTELPGHWVFIGTGQINFQMGLTPNGVNHLVSCSGGVGAAFGNGVQCNNTGCSTFTGAIAGAMLTVSAAPTGTSCTLAVGIPIAGSNVTLSKFGTPTVITGMSGSANCPSCTGAGGTGTYLVNISQTAASSTMVLGWRLETSVTTPETTITSDQWFIKMTATGAGSLQASNFAVLYNGSGGAGAGDESAYWASATPCGNGQACIVGSLFKQRVKTQGNFAVLRDLDWMGSNVANCTLWSTRKPVNYYSWGQTYEARNAPSGTTTYVAGGHTYTIPFPGQYVDATGTGASGGTVSYNAGTDTYSITLGTGAPVDKQTILMMPPATGTANSLISIDGTTAISIASATGSTPAVSTFIPTLKRLAPIVYDAAIGHWLVFSDNGANGLACGAVPPEVFIEINAELGTTPWHTLPFLALDSMTDWVSGFATYLKANYTPTSKPIFEGPNEPFNCVTYDPNYLSVKSTVWINADTNHAWTSDFFCGGNGANYGEEAKMLNTTGQDLNTVYGAGNYELLAPVQTYFGGASVANEIMRTTGYLGQSMSPQTGYNNTDPTYKIATRISINDYWASGWYGVGNTNWVKGLETGAAYCYYNYSISTPCQSAYVSQAAVMTAYMNTTTSATYNTVTASASQLLVQQQQWQTFGANCSEASRPAGCTVNQTTPLMNYEGGYNEGTVPTSSSGNSNSSGDIIQPAVLSSGGAITAGSYAVLSAAANTCQINSAGNPTITVPNNGCVVGMTVAIAGSQSVATTTASAGWAAGASSISVASCSGVSSGQYVADSTTGNFVGNVNTCTGTTLTLKQFTDSAFAFSSGSSSDAIVFSTATITYTGSNTWINYLRALSYLAPELTTLTTTVYNNVTGNGGINPSQYQLSSASASAGNSNQWLVFAFDIYGYYPVGNSSSVTIASNTATLGGAIRGVFRIGDILLGGGAMTPNSIITGCTPIGANVCGTTSGDQLTLSQSSTVSSGIAMTGNVVPGAAGSGMVSPVRSFEAICTWNGNGGAC